MPKNATIQPVQVRRATRSRTGRAEIFTIGPRKALMEQLEARATINRSIFVPSAKTSTRQK